MKSATENNPTHHSAVLLRQARESWNQIHAHRLENLRKQAKELLDQFRRSEAPAIERFAAHHPNFPKDDVLPGRCTVRDRARARLCELAQDEVQPGASDPLR